MKLALAKALAESLVTQMRPHCDRIEIAGSIRRQRDEVKDIEIVAIPKMGTRMVPDGLFDAREEEFNTLIDWCDTKAKIDWHKRGTRQHSGVTRAMRVQVDLFMCTPENWGNILLIRTGSAEFNEQVMTHARRIGWCFSKGRLCRAGVPVEVREEADVFRLLNLPYVEPCHRTGAVLFSRGRRDVVQLADDATERADDTLTEMWNGENASPGAQVAARRNLK